MTRRRSEWARRAHALVAGLFLVCALGSDVAAQHDDAQQPPQGGTGIVGGATLDIADLPTAASLGRGAVIVRDALSPTDCTVGGASTWACCFEKGTAWAPCAGVDAPASVNYLVGTADAVLTAEIIVGTTPGGILGNTWASPTIDVESISFNDELQNVATARLLGRVTAAAGDVEELTGTQATTLLDVFTSALKGLVPASGGVATNFLNAAGGWTVPVGTAEVNDLEAIDPPTILISEIYVGQGTGVGAFVAMSQDATMSSGGLVTVVDDSHAHTGTSISALDAADTTTGVFADARIDGSLEADEVNPTLGTQTQGNFVASVATTGPLGGGAAGSEGAVLTLSIADADDDGITKGAATFDNTHFNATAGVVTIASVVGVTGADADNVTLADVQAALSNDFHNVGGTDDDVPEVGDFGALVGGAGIDNNSGTLVTDSTEANFIADGGTGTLTCGGSNQGKFVVRDDGTFEYCDGATTSVARRYAPDSPMVDVTTRCAVGNGTTPNEACFRTLFNVSGWYYIPAGTFLVNELVRITTSDNVRITMHPGAVIKFVGVPSGCSWGGILVVRNADNVWIEGGTIDSNLQGNDNAVAVTGQTICEDPADGLTEFCATNADCGGGTQSGICRTDHVKGFRLTGVKIKNARAASDMTVADCTGAGAPYACCTGAGTGTGCPAHCSDQLSAYIGEGGGKAISLQFGIEDAFIDDILIENADIGISVESKSAASFNGGNENITISNVTVRDSEWMCLYLLGTSATPPDEGDLQPVVMSNIQCDNCAIGKTGQGVITAEGAWNYQLDNIRIRNSSGTVTPWRGLARQTTADLYIDADTIEDVFNFTKAESANGTTGLSRYNQFKAYVKIRNDVNGYLVTHDGTNEVMGSTFDVAYFSWDGANFESNAWPGSGQVCDEAAANPCDPGDPTCTCRTSLEECTTNSDCSPFFEYALDAQSSYDIKNLSTGERVQGNGPPGPLRPDEGNASIDNLFIETDVATGFLSLMPSDDRLVLALKAFNPTTGTYQTVLNTSEDGVTLRKNLRAPSLTALPANTNGPDVSAAWMFKTANTAATTYTNFASGGEGQQITIVIDDANTTVDFSTNANLKGNDNVDLAAGTSQGDVLTCVKYGTPWYCHVAHDEASSALTLVGDVDGALGSNDLDEAAVETEMEAVLDLAGLQEKDIDSLTGQDLWGTAATKTSADLTFTSTGWPVLYSAAGEVAGSCDAAGEAGRLWFDTNLDTDGSVLVCRGVAGWKDIDDDGGGGAFLALDGSTTMTGQIKAGQGTAAAPSVVSGGNPDTGMYFDDATDKIVWATAGTLRMILDSLLLDVTPGIRSAGSIQAVTSGAAMDAGGLDLNGGTIEDLAVGAVGTPSLYFTGDTNTGLFRPGADRVALVVAGAQFLELATTGLLSNIGGFTFEAAGGADIARLEAIAATDGGFRILNYTATTTGVAPLLELYNDSSGVMGVGGGSDVDWALEDAGGAKEIAATMRVRWDTATDGSEKSDVLFYAMHVGDPVGTYTGDTITADDLFLQYDSTLRRVTLQAPTATTNAVAAVARIYANSTGTAAVGFGPEVTFGADTNVGSNSDMGGLAYTWTDLTASSFDAKATLNVRVNHTVVPLMDWSAAAVEPHVPVQLEDMDASPVADRRLRVIDGIVQTTDTSNVEGAYLSNASHTAALRSGQCSINLLNPAATDGGKVTCWVPEAATLTRVSCQVGPGATTATIDICKIGETTLSTGTVCTTDPNTLAANLVCDNTPATTACSSGCTTTISSASVSADNRLGLHFSADSTAATDWLQVHLEWQY